MTVVFLPDITEFNPYQTNLASALDEDVVFGGESRYLPILDPVRSTEDVSVVHFHWLHLYLFSDSKPKTVVKVLLTVVQLLVIWLKGIPIVWTVHNVISHDSPYPRLERWFKHGFIRFGLCAHLFVHCEDVENRIVEKYRLPESVRQQVSVIPHGHYIDNYENEVSRADARSEFGFDEDKLVLLFFGAIKSYKGVFNLIEVFKSIEAPEYRLLIVGNPVTDLLKRKVKQRTADDDRIRHVLEFVPDEDIQRYMNAADVVALPYTEITTSGSAILTMSFGQPMVVPRLGCVPEMVDEKGAILYPPRDDKGLRSALLEAKHRDLSAMGNHNLALVRQYNWSTIAERTVHVYDRVTGTS